MGICLIVLITKARMSTRFDYEKIDVVEFLKGLGIRNVRDSGLEVSFSCPFDHFKGDRNPSATMSKTTVVKNNGDEYPPTTFYCFGCGKAGTAVTFLSEIEGVSPLIARKMLRQQFGMSFKEPEDSFVTEIMDRVGIGKPEKFPARYEQPEIKYPRPLHAVWASAVINVQKDSPYAYLVHERGFTPKILNHFKIGVDWRNFRVAIPLFDERNRLVGFKGRSFVGHTPKYLVLGGDDYDFPTCDVSLILFGLPQAQESEGWMLRGELNVVEGELNAIAMHQKGYPNTVGISGQYLSDRQADLLKDCQSVNIIFDVKDKAIAAAKKIERYVKVSFAPPRERDPADMNGEEIITMMNSLEKPYLL
jgi:DNA primase